MNTKQCEGCKHWMFLSGLGINACHYLLHTEEPRSRNGDRCLSYEPENNEEQKAVWPEYPSCKSTTLGYTRK